VRREWQYLYRKVELIRMASTENDELDRITASVDIIFKSDFIPLDRLAATMTPRSVPMSGAFIAPGITPPTASGSSPAASASSNPATAKFEKCWKKFEADLLACGAPSRQALWKCLGTARPTLIDANRCAEVANAVTLQCHKKAELNLKLCLQTEITTDDVLAERLARQLDRANEEARSKPKAASAKAAKGVAVGGAAIALAGLVIKARETKLATTPGPGASLKVAGSYLAVVGGLTAFVSSILAAVDPPRGDFRRVDVVGVAQNTLPPPSNDLEAAVGDLIPALLTYARAIAAVTKGMERLDGLRAAQKPKLQDLLHAYDQIGAVQANSRVAALAIEEAARVHIRLETAWSAQLNELRQYKPEEGVTLLKKDWSSDLPAIAGQIGLTSAERAAVRKGLLEQIKQPGSQVLDRVLPDGLLESLLTVASALHTYGERLSEIKLA
jgi:hypothetical protein